MEFAAEIFTDRLWLRPLKKRDLYFFVKLTGNRRVRHYLGGSVGWRRRLSNFRQYLAAPAYVGVWLVCLRNAKRPIGLVELGPHKDGKDYEVSYQFDPTYWGRGFASEAVRAVVKQALDGHGLSQIIAETQSANAASRRLLRNQGMVEIDRVHRFGAEQVIFCTTRKQTSD